MRGRVGQVTLIDVLSDDVLLAIFDFCPVGDGYQDRKRAIEAWQSLVHVCRRWRSLVFQSPRRLNLRLVCTPRTPARESLDVWPALPLLIEGIIPSSSVDNIVVALGHSGRVCRINLGLVCASGRLQWDKVLAAMQVPFPELTHLGLFSNGETLSIISDTFLGGSAPRLQYLVLERISFPGIPSLLLSAPHLVYLCLHHIPDSGYISPEAMAICLSVLTSLDNLSLEFRSPRSHPDRESRRPPSMTRFILPDLTSFRFKGVSEYLEDLVARIDTPRLHNLSITFLHQIHFDTPHLVQFISRTPRFEESCEAFVRFRFDAAEVRLLSWTSDLCVEISCEGGESDQLLSSMAQVCIMCLPSFPVVENLRVFTESLPSEFDCKDDDENNQWLELLRPFTAVESLYLSWLFQPRIASALQELVGGRMTEVLPSLQNIFLERLEPWFDPSGPFQEAIGQFVARPTAFRSSYSHRALVKLL